MSEKIGIKQITEPHYIRICYEHEKPLHDDGTCPDCRDENNQPFVLDMQSYYLVTPEWWAIQQKRRENG